MEKSRERTTRLLVISLALLLVSGCATFKTEVSGRFIDERRLGEVAPGVTTKKDILDAFGEPSEVKRKEDGGETLYYIYRETQVPSYLGGLIEKSAVVTKETTLEITIKDNTVTDYRFSSAEE